MWTYYNPVKIIFSDSFVYELTKILDRNKKILLICSKRFSNSIDYQNIMKSFTNVTTFNNIENNPSFVSCNKAIKFGFEIRPDVIIVIGGGSVIDTAKSVRLALNKEIFTLEELFLDKREYKNKIKFIAIPTTHGTGSELTKWATIWNKKEKKKYSLSDNDNYPDYAIYDYHLANSLPLEVSLITTLDALSHSFEALWNKNANPISDEYAIKAIKLILENIGQLREQTTKETRINLLKANIYSGLAFSNTKTAAAHSISYPLTALFGIPHGIACSITLYSLMRINKPFIEDKIERLLKITNFQNIEKLWMFVKEKVKGTIKFSLREYEISEKNLDNIVANSFNKDRIGNNIKKLNKKDIKNILMEVL